MVIMQGSSLGFPIIIHYFSGLSVPPCAGCLTVIADAGYMVVQAGISGLEHIQPTIDIDVEREFDIQLIFVVLGGQGFKGCSSLNCIHGSFVGDGKVGW